MNLNSLDPLLAWLDKLQGLPAAGLAMVSCLAVGYILRYVKFFPNDGIPVAVTFWGAIAMMFLADPRATTMAPHVWIVRNFCIGLVLGAGSWLLHYYFIWKAEEWLKAKFPRKEEKPNPTPPTVL
jgi:hypothetical protein